MPAAKGRPQPHRRTIRTPENRASVLQAIELGLSDKASCEYAGISTALYYDWLKADPTFLDDVTRARGKFRAVLQTQIREAAQQDWRAGAWLLARRCPEDYAERQVIDVNESSPLDKMFGGAPVADGPADDTPEP